MASFKLQYLKKMLNRFFLNSARVKYGLFVTRTENLARLRCAVAEIWCREKVGASDAPPPSKSRVKRVEGNRGQSFIHSDSIRRNQIHGSS